MGGDISAVVASPSRRPRTSMCLVKAGSRPVQIATPAFQSNPGLPRFHPRSSGVLSTIFDKIVGHLTLSPQANALVANLLTLNPPSSKLSGTCPLAKASLSRRQQFITRFARLNKQRSGDFRLFPPANFANSAILPTDKISAFFMQNFLLQKPKDSSLLCPKPHRGRMIAFATAVRSGPSSFMAREIPASLAFKAAPRKCKQASISLGLH